MLRINEQFLEALIRGINFEDAFDWAVYRMLETGDNMEWFDKKYWDFLLEEWQITPYEIFISEAVRVIEEGKDEAFAIIEEELYKAKPQIIEILKEAVKNAIRKEVGGEPILEHNEAGDMEGILAILVAAVDKGLAAADKTKEIEELYKDAAEQEELQYDIDSYKEVLNDACEFVRSLEEMFGSPLTDNEGNIVNAMYELESFVKDKVEDVKSAMQYLETAQLHLVAVITSETGKAEEKVVQRLFESDELATLVELQEKLSSMLEKVFVF